MFAGSGQTYYLAWPYHCATGVRCPPALRYRALAVTGGAQPGDGRGLQAVRAALRRIVDTVRPITSALPAGASSSRPACQLAPRHDPVRSPASRFRRSAPDDRHPLVGAGQMVEGTVGGHADFFLVFATRELAMCHLQARFTVELLQGGRLAAVQGNGAVVTLDGDLPEGDGEFPTLSTAWLWRTGAAARTCPCGSGAWTAMTWTSRPSTRCVHAAATRVSRRPWRPPPCPSRSTADTPGGGTEAAATNAAAEGSSKSRSRRRRSSARTRAIPTAVRLTPAVPRCRPKPHATPRGRAAVVPQRELRVRWLDAAKVPDQLVVVSWPLLVPAAGNQA